MPKTLPAPSDSPPVDEPDCGPGNVCPTHTTPGTVRTAITTVHVPSCPSYRPGARTTCRYVDGDIDARLERFGPVSAPELLAERFGGTR